MIRLGFLASVQRLLLAVLVVVVLTVVSLGVHAYLTWRRYMEDSMPQAPGDGLSADAPVLSSSGNGSRQEKPLIGLVAGHWDSDSGAVCPDGLTEAEINLDVTERVFSLLSRAGYQVEMLPEFSSKLDGYQAAALVSIHTDSCNVSEATGFKVARVSSSLVPEVEDRLVACLIEHYGRVTGLQVHQNSITFDMTEYHAFFEIAPDTPAAIIEIGFMAADRSLLTRRPDIIARGIYEGILCFVEPEG